MNLEFSLSRLLRTFGLLFLLAVPCLLALSSTQDRTIDLQWQAIDYLEWAVGWSVTRIATVVSVSTTCVRFHLEDPFPLGFEVPVYDRLLAREAVIGSTWLIGIHGNAVVSLEKVK